jgi:predicted alpha/beta-fold hydrolase
MTYSPPWYLFNRHLETIYPALFRKANNGSSDSERVATKDKDFIDLDFYNIEADKTVILSHGLEGNSKKPYMIGMINTLLNAGFNCVAWNFRGCSGIHNRHAYSYHSGATQDLDYIIEKTEYKFPLTKIYLIGFSLGGNLTLKYLGENSLNSRIEKAIAVSVPLDLHQSCMAISKKSNWIYTKRFLKTLKRKISDKAKLFPHEINVSGIKEITNLLEFDDRYTAPLHGFKNAIDYYTQCSSINFLEKIAVPTLIINARNDPFLSPECYPENINKDFIKYDYPPFGGHLGFKMSGYKNKYYHEIKSLEFLSK